MRLLTFVYVLNDRFVGIGQPVTSTIGCNRSAWCARKPTVLRHVLLLLVNWGFVWHLFPPLLPKLFSIRLESRKPGWTQEPGSGRRIVARRGGHLKQVDTITIPIKAATHHGTWQSSRGAFHSAKEQ